MGCIISSIKNAFIPCSNLEKAVVHIPQIARGYVSNVYDGDTFTIVSYEGDCSSRMYKYRIRIRGIDCPEMRTKNKHEKEIAEIAQNEVHRLIYHKWVRLGNMKHDKYGRILADVSIGSIDLSRHLIAKRMAVPYFGKNKITPNNWKLYYLKQTSIISISELENKI